MNERKYGSILSICRHLAWRYSKQSSAIPLHSFFSDLSGKTAYDDAKVDDIAEKVYEIRMKLKNWIDHIEHAADHACDVGYHLYQLISFKLIYMSLGRLR